VPFAIKGSSRVHFLRNLEWPNLNVKNLRFCGCEVWVLISSNYRQKWNSKSREFIFVGYAENSKAYHQHYHVAEK
jgi:hypothetical protein